MKVTVKEKSETKEYPWIGITENGVIVLFFDFQKGIFITSENHNIYSLGEYRDNWTESNYKPFTGEIVLSNS